MNNGQEFDSYVENTLKDIEFYDQVAHDYMRELENDMEDEFDDGLYGFGDLLEPDD